MDKEDIVREAADMLSQDGENVEYDRAVVEFVARILFQKDWEWDTAKELAKAVIGYVG